MYFDFISNKKSSEAIPQQGLNSYGPFFAFWNGFRSFLIKNNQSTNTTKFTSFASCLLMLKEAFGFLIWNRLSNASSEWVGVWVIDLLHGNVPDIGNPGVPAPPYHIKTHSYLVNIYSTFQCLPIIFGLITTWFQLFSLWVSSVKLVVMNHKLVKTFSDVFRLVPILSDIFPFVFLIVL